jgi:hypothetical protein
VGEADLLQRLFRCERYVHLFGDAMPVKACLRRQLERLPTNDERGKPEAPGEWPAKNPFCAASCEVGRRHLEEARALKVPAETCLRCGGAQVGAGSAAPCARCPPDETAVPRGHLAVVAEPSSRIWQPGAVPDVPIGAPNPRQAARLEQQRAEVEKRAQARAVAERKVHQQEPARPAEEEGMARGVPAKKRTCCESKGGRHRADCTGEPREALPDAAEVRAPARAAARRAGRRAEANEGLELLTLEDLVEQRSQAVAKMAAVEAELKRRRDAIAEALGEG